MLRIHSAWLIIGLVLVVYHNNRGHNSAWAKSKYSWMKVDQFDEINDQISSINEHNCHSKSKAQLQLRKDVVSQLPVYNELLSRVWYKNRSSLIHIHNMALNRAFFYSYVLQKMNDSATFNKQPNWMYFYFASAADVNANPNSLNGSAFYFDQNCHYPNWYTTIAFNKTIPLFGPRSHRHDNTNDQGNFLREPTRTVVRTFDAGAGRFMNYTHPSFKMNPWYENWLPDLEGDDDSTTKFTYYINIKESNVTGQFTQEHYTSYAFFGPNSPSASDVDERLLPVQFTAPYFDCGGANKWVVSAVSPVVDYMPRYSNFTHLRRQRIVGVSVMDTDFREIDFNACGVSPGNPGPSYLSGIARCRPTTGCKHRPGFGFSRGGYSCTCKAGTQHPFFIERPYRGSNVEVATEEEYFNGFQCTPSHFQVVLPNVLTPRVTVEGMGVDTNSGGLTSDQLNRRRRSSGRNSSAIEPEGNRYTARNNLRYTAASQPTRPANPTQPKQQAGAPTTRMGVSTDNRTEGEGQEQGQGQPSMAEVIALADRLREMREGSRLRHYLKSQGDVVTLDPSELPDDYAERNNVDFSVEKEYKADLKQHRLFKDFLIQSDKTYGRRNRSRTVESIKDDVIQMVDRHKQRFHANRLSARSLHHRRKRSSVYDDRAFDNMLRIMRWRSSVSPSNCHTLPTHRLTLPGGVGYGADRQFENEGRTAVRLSMFLSLYLQNVMPDENFGSLRGGGPLHKDMMFGEVLANVMGNYRISSAGVYFDRYKFLNDDLTPRELFGPWAFRKGNSYFAVDTAGYSSQYLDSDWFRQAKARHGANFHGIKSYGVRGYIRNDPQGTSSVKHEFFPMKYKAAPYEVGFWTKPHFRCDGNVDEWVITYVSPFFGLDELRTRLEFRGVTTVDVPLRFLEINQCPMPYHVANAFKNTARCDYFSTNCGPLAGFPFLRGSYRCTCRLGFEYPHADRKTWIEGSLLELEYEKKRLGYFSRFDLLKCRPSSAPGLPIDRLLSLLLPTFTLVKLYYTS